MAEALFQRRLDARGTPAHVGSAGLLPGGSPATEAAIEVMAAAGLDISEHRSRQVSPHLLDESDLVVTMTRQHLIEVTLMAPAAWPRMFQAVDLLRRAEKVGPRDQDEPMADWLVSVGDGRTRSGILAASLSDDVEDPVGQSAAVYRRTEQQLDDLFTRLAALI
jgi:protein-tyrosine phosphatase